VFAGFLYCGDTARFNVAKWRFGFPFFEGDDWSRTGIRCERIRCLSASATNTTRRGHDKQMRVVAAVI
jgi:hypothetical protein